MIVYLISPNNSSSRILHVATLHRVIYQSSYGYSWHESNSGSKQSYQSWSNPCDGSRPTSPYMCKESRVDSDLNEIHFLVTLGAMHTEKMLWAHLETGSKTATGLPHSSTVESQQVAEHRASLELTIYAEPGTFIKFLSLLYTFC